MMTHSSVVANLRTVPTEMSVVYSSGSGTSPSPASVSVAAATEMGVKGVMPRRYMGKKEQGLFSVVAPSQAIILIEILRNNCAQGRGSGDKASGLISALVAKY